MNILKVLGVIIQDKDYKYVSRPMVNWINPLTYVCLPIAFIILLIKGKV